MCCKTKPITLFCVNEKVPIFYQSIGVPTYPPHDQIFIQMDAINYFEVWVWRQWRDKETERHVVGFLHASVGLSVREKATRQCYKNKRTAASDKFGLVLRRCRVTYCSAPAWVAAVITVHKAIDTDHFLLYIHVYKDRRRLCIQRRRCYRQGILCE